MNREIKFRAWVGTHKKMFQVVNMVIPKGLNEKGYQEIAVSETYSITKPHHYIQPVLMQYTGLKDCKGVEIYERDIFQINLSEPVENNYVEFDDGEYKLLPHGLSLAEWRLNGNVIGNIYENPELLK